MLENLDKVDWANLNCRDGKATDFPKYLQFLCSEDYSLYRQGYAIFHQCTMLEAHTESTAYVIPFLVQILRNEQLARRLDIFIALYNLFISKDPHRLISRYKFWEEVKFDESFENLEPKLRYFLAACDALYTCLDDIKYLLEHDSSVLIRCYAAAILEVLSDENKNLVPYLIRQLEYEYNPTVRAVIFKVLDGLMSVQQRQEFLENIPHDPDPLVRFFVLQIFPDVPLKSENLLEALLEPIDDYLNSSNMGTYNLLQIPNTIYPKDFKSLIHESIVKLAKDYPKQILRKCMNQFGEANFLKKVNLVQIILEALFGKPEEATPVILNKLDDFQRECLLKISREVLVIKGTNGKNVNGVVSNLLKEYGLPYYPQDLEINLAPSS